MNDTPMTKGDMQTILDHITSERQKTENYVHEELEKVNNRMDAMQKGISNLKSDVSTLKSDVSILKEGQARIDNNVTTIADELGISDKIKTA